MKTLNPSPRQKHILIVVHLKYLCSGFIVRIEKLMTVLSKNFILVMNVEQLIEDIYFKVFQ